MGTVGDYANELNDFYGKVQALEKAVPREFGYKLSSVLSAYYEMFSRFCPFRVGDRVRLAKTLVIEKGSGWYGSRHFLVEGAIGITRSGGSLPFPTPAKNLVGLIYPHSRLSYGTD